MRNLLLCLLVCCILPATAQTFRAAVLAGANLSQVDGDDLLGFYQPGINAGLRVVALLGDRWRVGPELLFTQQGSRRNRNSINISDFDRIRLNTVELPLMVYYKDWRITAEAGGSFQRLINYRIEDAGGGDVTANYALKDNVFALKFGVTVYLTEQLGVNFRWSRHLTDLQVADSPRWRGRTLTLRAVYTIGGGESLPNAPTATPGPTPNQ